MRRKVAQAVLKTRPKMSTKLVIPCWKMESARVLMMITSAHWTCKQWAITVVIMGDLDLVTWTMARKLALLQVNSRVHLCE